MKMEKHEGLLINPGTLSVLVDLVVRNIPRS